MTLRSNFRILLIILSLFALCVNALAIKSPVGKWTGKLMDVGPGKTMTAAQGASLLKMAKVIRVAIVFKADKTYTVDTTGSGQKEHHVGTWIIAGSKITLKNDKGQPETGSISSDSNKITIPLPAAAIFTGKLVLKRQ